MYSTMKTIKEEKMNIKFHGKVKEQWKNKEWIQHNLAGHRQSFTSLQSCQVKDKYCIV